MKNIYEKGISSPEAGPPFGGKLSIRIITLFPKFIENFVESFGIVKRAIKLNLLDIKAINLRSLPAWTTGRQWTGGHMEAEWEWC